MARERSTYDVSQDETKLTIDFKQPIDYVVVDFNPQSVFLSLGFEEKPFDEMITLRFDGQIDPKASKHVHNKTTDKKLQLNIVKKASEVEEAGEAKKASEAEKTNEAEKTGEAEKTNEVEKTIEVESDGDKESKKNGEKEAAKNEYKVTADHKFVEKRNHPKADPRGYQVKKPEKKNWDKIVATLDDSDEGEGDANSALKKIYDGCDDDTKRAMEKSLYESHGTVLNMNWGEVGKGKVKPYESSDADNFKGFDRFDRDRD